ncbi:MAG: methyl-accepting chemotaxis protein [Xanthobacteraceae bacterium]
MAIEPGFEVRLGIYRIDADVVSLRGEIWRLLAPRLDAIIAAYLANVFQVAPLYRKKMEESRKSYADMIKLYTERLLNNPFDEAWVQDAYDRAAAEIKVGLDMRNRSASSIALLGDLNECMSHRYRFSPRKGFRLINAATRIFMLDAANAVACHNKVEVQQAKERTDALANAIEQFAHAVEGVRQTVSNVIGAISSASDQLAELARTASNQTAVASHAAEDTASRIGSIAAATDELNVSIDEIHAHAVGNVQTAQSAVTHAERTDENIRSLSQAVEKIGSVVSLISEIAEQTNLLALNATIEAARAGEAGRGFAVVASEVKSLAVQTAKATDDVRKQISLVQEAMHCSMSEIAAANQSISEISNASSSLTGMVVEQARAANEIAESANSTRLNAATVTDALKTMGGTIRCTQDATSSVLGLAADLSVRAAEIGKAMDALFKTASQSSTVKELANLARSSRH